MSTITAPRTLEILGNRVTIHVDSAASGGRFAVVEYVAGPGFAGPPLHTHPGFDETFCVLDGTPSFVVDGEVRAASAGDVVHVRGTTPHTFANLADAPARIVLLLSPGGFEAYFEALAELLAGGGAPDPAAIGALSGRFGVISA